MNFIEKLGLLLFLLGTAAMLETAIENKKTDAAIGGAAMIIGTLAFLLGDLIL